MPFVFLDDPRLYRDYQHCRDAFHWPPPEGEPETIIYHCYWSGPLTPHHELSVKSLLLTQSPPYEVWIWVPPEDLPRNQEWLSSLGGLSPVRLKAFHPEAEAAGTIYEDHLHLPRGKDWLGPGRWRQSLNVSNCLRILALGRYGGVYLDLDNLFLRDLRPLCTVDFLYQWSGEPYCNNAVLRFRKDSPNAWCVAERTIEMDSCRPHAVLRLDQPPPLPEPLYVLPVFLFDPVWVAHDTAKPINDYCNTFEDFFSDGAPITIERFFPGAYTYHWHNQWTVPIGESTLAGHLYRDVCSKLDARIDAGVEGPSRRTPSVRLGVPGVARHRRHWPAGHAWRIQAREASQP